MTFAKSRIQPPRGMIDRVCWLGIRDVFEPLGEVPSFVGIEAYNFSGSSAAYWSINETIRRLPYIGDISMRKCKMKIHSTMDG